MNVFISQPMKGLTLQEINAERIHVLEALEKYYNEEIVLIEQFFDKDLHYTPVTCLAESLKMMEHADVIVFTGKWEGARGCQIEHEVAREYGVAKIAYAIKTPTGVQILEEQI